MSLVELFCHVDDFCQAFEPLWIRDYFPMTSNLNVVPGTIFHMDNILALRGINSSTIDLDRTNADHR